MTKRIFAMLIVLCTAAVCHARGGDTITTEIKPAAVAEKDSVVRKKGLINRFLQYLDDSNKPKSREKFDFSLLGGPHYSTDTKLGLGLVASGIYYTDKADTTLLPSTVAIYGDITTANFYKLGVRGTTIFPHNKYRLTYNVSIESFKSKFWGIGYADGSLNSNESMMMRRQVEAKVTFVRNIAENLYIGPAAIYNYVAASDIERPDLLRGMDTHTWNVGLGVSFVYDSRDVLTNPHRGMYIDLLQCFRPRFMGNDYAFSTTALRVCGYMPAWKGAVIAAEVHGTFNYGNPSWGMMSQLGSSYAMRGYYEGRFRDKHKIDAQLELRQHVWKRNGIVAWMGAGTVFNRIDGMRSKHILPNFGIGYRWEFKKNMNIRLDYGFGSKGQSGFIFNMNEAF